MEERFGDHVRIAHCPDWKIVSVNLAIEAEVGFGSPQNGPLPNDVNLSTSIQASN